MVAGSASEFASCISFLCAQDVSAPEGQLSLCLLTYLWWFCKAGLPGLLQGSPFHAWWWSISSKRECLHQRKCCSKTVALECIGIRDSVWKEVKRHHYRACVPSAERAVLGDLHLLACPCAKVHICLTCSRQNHVKTQFLLTRCWYFFHPQQRHRSCMQGSSHSH